MKPVYDSIDPKEEDENEVIPTPDEPTEPEEGNDTNLDDDGDPVHPDPIKP